MCVLVSKLQTSKSEFVQAEEVADLIADENAYMIKTIQINTTNFNVKQRKLNKIELQTSRKMHKEIQKHTMASVEG